MTKPKKKIKKKAPTKWEEQLKIKGYSQSDLYRIIKAQSLIPVTTRSISTIVRGKKTNYTTETLMKMCNALGVTPADVLDKEDYTHLWKP